MPAGTARVTHDVTWLDRRKHARAVLALDQGAAADPGRLYGAPFGKPFYLTELVEFLKRGAGLVAVTGPRVDGFCLYTLTRTTVDVERLVSAGPGAEAALLAAIELTRRNSGREDVLLPVVVDLF